MSFRTTYLLFGTLLGLLGVFAITLYLGPKPKDASAYVLPSVHRAADPVEAKQIDRLEIHRVAPKEEKLVFVRAAEGGDWRMAEPHAARTDQGTVDNAVRQLLDLRIEPARDTSPDLSKFGLDNPRATLTISKGDRQWQVQLGEQSGERSTGVTYVLSSDRKEVMVVRSLDLDGLTKPAADYRSRDLLAQNAFDIQSASVKGAKGEVALAKGDANKWRFTTPTLGLADYEGDTNAPPVPPEAPKTVTSVRVLLETLAAVKVQGTEDFVANSESDLAKYGLEAGKSHYRFEVKRNASGLGEDKKTITEVLLIGKKTDDKGDKLYARLDGENNVVRVDAKNVAAIARVLDNPAVLRDRTLVQVDQFTTKADALDIKVGADPLIKLRQTPSVEERWKLFVEGAAAGRKAHELTVNDLFQALAAPRIVRDFPDPNSKDADLGFDKPTAVVSAWVEGVVKEEKKEEKKEETKGDAKAAEKKDEKKEEKKDPAAEPKLKTDKPTVRLTFGIRDPKNKDLVFVKRESGGEVALLSVPDTLLTKFSEKPVAFLDKLLPKFAVGAEVEKDVARLVIVRGGETHEVVQEKKDPKDARGAWKLKAPKELDGRNANGGNVGNILFALNGLEPERLVAEKPSEADLDQKYGLKTPQAQATISITKDGKTEDYVYAIGKEVSPMSERYYARLNKRDDLVFEVRKDLLTNLASSLQDPTVLTFDLAKLKGLKVTGWQKATGTGSPFTFEAERKSATDWAAKAPPMWPLDPTKAERFAQALASLRADEVLGPKATTPADAFDPKTDAQEIVLTIDGEKDPVTLTIGAEDAGGKNYYCRTSKLPGQGFLLSKSRFEEFRKLPLEAFGKK